MGAGECGSDLDLARRAVDGDEAAWRTIYDSTVTPLFSLLCYQVRRREEALDLLQETYLRAFRHLRDYRGDAPIENWLRVIAMRLAIDWKRTLLQRMKRTVVLTESLVRVEPPDRDFVGENERSRLHRALESLSRIQRAVLLLRELEDWSFREIAQTVGCSESTARVHHTRARKRMRRLLGRRAGTVPAVPLKGEEA